MKYGLLCIPLLTSLAMPAQALECSVIHALPLPLSLQTGAPQGSDTCFSFTTNAPGLRITAMNSIQVLWSGPEQAPFLEYRSSIDSMTLTALGSDTVLAPVSNETIRGYGWSPHGEVPYPAGQIASYVNLAPGAYQLTLRMGEGFGFEYQLGIQSLAPVPEPTSAALMAAGLLVAGGWVMRNRRCRASSGAL